MKRQDILRLILVGVLAAFISLLISSVIFRVPKNRSSKVPTVEAIPTSLPDLKNDSAYKTFFNKNAIDLTQPVQIGNSQNTTPFNSSQ